MLPSSTFGSKMVALVKNIVTIDDRVADGVCYKNDGVIIKIVKPPVDKQKIFFST